jgi:hypothetical protein
MLKSGLAGLSQDEFDEESLDEDRAGSPAEEIEQLEFTDSRAVDFRNYLRIWSAHRINSSYLQSDLISFILKVWGGSLVIDSYPRIILLVVLVDIQLATATD